MQNITIQIIIALNLQKNNISKINKGDGIFGFNNITRKHKIHLYFLYNKITLQKINLIEKETGFNLKEYKLKLKR